MPRLLVCPFYGKDDDYCDVGCGYITSHDVSIIIKHCSADFSACFKYRELAERYPDLAKTSAIAGSLPEKKAEPALCAPPLTPLTSIG